MNRLLLLPLLLLASCAPLLQAVQGEAGTLVRDGADVLLVNPGKGDMTETVLRVEGPGLTLGSPCAQRAANVYGCLVGSVPEGKKYRITPLTGSVTKASANFYRVGSDLFKHIELP